MEGEGECTGERRLGATETKKQKGHKLEMLRTLQ